MIVFKKVSTSEPVVAYLVAALKQHLARGEKVLWLVPGGSAIAVAVSVATQLSGVDATNLTITLTDERYGNIGHADSNWQQLQTAGFDLPGAKLLPVLNGGDIQTATLEWQMELHKLLTTCDYRLGFLGMGPDGHTSGILPDSPAVESTDLVAHYDGGQFQRITTTAAALTKLDEVVVLAMGEAKRQALEGLRTVKTLDEQPAQLFKHIPTCIIFNDVIGDEL